MQFVCFEFQQSGQLSRSHESTQGNQATPKAVISSQPLSTQEDTNFYEIVPSCIRTISMRALEIHSQDILYLLKTEQNVPGIEIFR